jgi:hypothetical protein
MRYRGALAFLGIATALLPARQQPGQEELISRIRERVREALAGVPNYTCAQTIQRLARGSQAEEFRTKDTLRLEVAVVGDRERYSWVNAREFDERDLAELVGSGMVGTGSFASHAHKVFLRNDADFEYRGEERIGDRRVLRFDYRMPPELRTYAVNVPPHHARVAWHGSFWVDPATLDLVRLAVYADDLPETLPVLRVSDVMDYARAPIGGRDALLPSSSELTMAWSGGGETRNRTDFTRCREFRAESSLVTGERQGREEPPAETVELSLPPNSPLELSLESPIEPATAAAGDAIRATVVSPLKQGVQVIVPAGTPVSGRLVRVEKIAVPYDHYVIGLEFDTLELGGAAVVFSASMREVSGAAGIIRQARRLNPTFTPRRRRSRMDILVREHQEGRGILYWDARHARIPRGLKMRWITESARAEGAR